MEAALILQFITYIFLPIFPNSRPLLTFFFGVSEILAKKVSPIVKSALPLSVVHRYYS